jgi:hypothetical protein
VSPYGKVEEVAKMKENLSRRYESLFAFRCAQAEHALYTKTKKRWMADNSIALWLKILASCSFDDLPSP